MNDAAHSPPSPTNRLDYRPPHYQIGLVQLDFDLRETGTRVRSTLSMTRAEGVSAAEPLELDGRDLRLLEVYLNGTPCEYEQIEGGLRIAKVPERFELTTVVELRPETNRACAGLYRSGGVFCTQCEAEDFRRITPFLDRPDVSARWEVRIEADRARYPVLLSNGDRVESGEEGERHWVRWRDPHPKPSYLFALVAGDLECVRGQYTTASGRQVALELYVEHGEEARAEHAMASLQRAMRWDEERFGLEYDLDTYMIVAVRDFNMGAMENKGLNVFNSKYVLGTSKTATDDDLEAIEAVIGHEYFHNWTGNRVTCRDWFQLTLKEGLTVFRDEEFTSDLHSRAIKRVRDVALLRRSQFAEDQGPLAHPIRPDSYVDMNNFYTVTVYNKGSEVVRMLHTLVGEKAFRAGLRAYLEAHDGSAATCEDFVQAMGAAGEQDLEQFMRWYARAGTPRVEATSSWESDTLSIQLRQKGPARGAGASEKAWEPLHVPIRVAFRDGNGGLVRPDGAEADEQILHLKGLEQSFAFKFPNRDTAPDISWLRGFSAPIQFIVDRDCAELARCVAQDDDPFASWDAAQELYARAILGRYEGAPDASAESSVEQMLTSLLARPGEPASCSLRLALPGPRDLAPRLEAVDYPRLQSAISDLRSDLAKANAQALEELHDGLVKLSESGDSAEAAAARRLRSELLNWLAALPSGSSRVLACASDAENMTLRQAGMLAAIAGAVDGSGAALDAFATEFASDPLVMDKWFGFQAAAPRAETLARVQELTEDPRFEASNPNRVRALLGTYALTNPAALHAGGVEAYRFVGDWVLRLDADNPGLASRLGQCFAQHGRLEPGAAALMRAELERCRKTQGVSRELKEVFDRAIEA